MKRTGLILIAILLMALPMFSQTVSIPDTAFLYALIDEGVDTNGDSLISPAEADAVISLKIDGDDYGWGGIITRGIKDLKGIEAFANLDTLSCSINEIVEIDLSNNLGLTYFNCYHNVITNLDITKNLMLETLIINDNQLTGIDVSENSQLSGIYCGSNQLISIDISNNELLETLACGNNQVTELDLTNNTALTDLDISDCPIEGLDISNNMYLRTLSGTGTQISQLEISDYSELDDVEWRSGSLSSLSITNCQALKSLNCHTNQIVDFRLTACPSLTGLNCGGNQITHLDVSAFPLLEKLYCWRNELTQLDISKCPHLKILYCQQNSITQLDVSQNLKLVAIECRANDLTHLDVSNHSFLAFLLCSGNAISNLDLTFCTELRGLDCGFNNLTTLDLSSSNRIGNWGDRNSWGYISAIFPALGLNDMPSLGEVCTWVGFNPDSLDMDISHSPNVYFTSECSDYLAPNIIIAIDTLYQPDYIEATSSKDGVIYLVPEETDKDLATIRGACIDSVVATANTPINVPFSGLENGIYWLYARDSTGNISEPEAFTVMGVGIEESRVKEIRIYPNPTNNLLTIETYQSEHSSVNITSLNGQQILIGEMEGTSHQIDLSSFQKGVYLITIRSKDFITTRKIIKL